jgi:hypothetical protein
MPLAALYQLQILRQKSQPSGAGKHACGGKYQVPFGPG